MKHPFADLIGLVFESHSKGKSHYKLEVKEEHYNPQNVVHGGVLYSLADTGCVFRVVITTDSAFNLPPIPFFAYH